MLMCIIFRAVKVKKERSHDGSKPNSTPKSALNTPSALNSVHTPPKVKQEPVSPAKSRKEIAKPSKHVSKTYVYTSIYLS